MQALIYGRAGDSEKAASALKKLDALKRRQRIDPLDFVAAYIGLGDNDKALFWLNKACLEHSPSLTAIKVDPIYDSLRGDSRFQDVLRRMRLAQ